MATSSFLESPGLWLMLGMASLIMAVVFFAQSALVYSQTPHAWFDYLCAGLIAFGFSLFPLVMSGALDHEKAQRE